VPFDVVTKMFTEQGKGAVMADSEALDRKWSQPNCTEMAYRIGLSWARFEFDNPVSHTVLSILDEPGFAQLSLENILGRVRKSLPHNSNNGW
jgi:hypothetical protein